MKRTKETMKRLAGLPARGKRGVLEQKIVNMMSLDGDYTDYLF